MKLVASTRRLREDQGGFSLIEVTMAMAIFALLLAVAALNMGEALTQTRNDRSRSVAANLASEEIDQARTGGFQNVPLGLATSTQTVDGVTYTIRQIAQWIKKGATSGPCSGVVATSSLAYLRVDVAVAWSTMAGAQAVKAQTLLAPPVGLYNPNSGNVALTVTDHGGSAVSGIPATLSAGGAGVTRLTDDEGCAFYAYLPAGTGTASLAAAGYVDGQGNPAPSQAITVSKGATTTLQFSYDLAATAAVTLQGVTGAPVPSNVAVTVYNTSILPNGLKAVAGTGASRTIPNLYPYTSGYQIWGGDCADADPGAVNRTSPFAVTPGRTSVVPPVVLPAVTATVKRGFIAGDITPYGCRDGDVFVQGTLKGRLADHNVYLSGDVTYASPGTAGTATILGLIGNNYVEVMHPVSCTTSGSASCNLNVPSRGTPFTNPQIYAAILSVQHSFRVQNYNAGSPLGTLNVDGAIAQRYRGIVGTFSGAAVVSGYAKGYVYDTRLRYLEPPRFLDPVKSGWLVSTWAEIKTPTRFP